MTLAERAAAIEKVVKGMTPGEWKHGVEYAFVFDAALGREQPTIARTEITFGSKVVRSPLADLAGAVALRNDAPALVADLVAENEALKGMRRDAVSDGFFSALSYANRVIEAAWKELTDRVGASPNEFQRGKMHGLSLALTMTNPDPENESAVRALRSTMKAYDEMDKARFVLAVTR